ncbi:MAG: PKD domain-containing protein [Bryobacteraceae bacterium]
MKALPKPLTEQQTSQIVDTRTAEQIERARMPRFSIVGLNAGLDQSRDLTFTGRGRFFMPFKEQFAVQAQGEYMYFRDRQEGQADIGLVNRFLPRAQADLFASFKHVNFTGNTPGRSIFTDRPISQFSPGQIQGNGTLGQASFTLDYLFSRGKFGVFATKGFMEEALLNSTALSSNVFNQAYLRTIDQFGLSTLVGLAGDSYMEGNLGYLKSRGNANRAGGTLRFVFPLSERFAFTLEGGLNETLLSRDNNGRVVAGFQFGNFMRPKDYLEGYNGVQHAVPADVPRVRYEVLTRTVRTGNDAPVADAGPDQIGVAAGTINLDGSASTDPDGDVITYQWTQLSGPAVSLSGMNTSRISFTAAEGQSYSFRLTVRDSQGQTGTDSVVVTTSSRQAVQIIRFQASPDRIRAGEQSTIDWQVLNADTVTITPGIGTVGNNGSRQVSPAQTTRYTLTARNSSGDVTATTTVVVEALPPAQFLACTVSPMNIMPGESATITYNTANADQVMISGIGPVDSSGSRVVSPTQTTSYTLTATNAAGPVLCNLTVQVTPGTAPRVIAFTANPTTITAGQSSTLTYNVEGAESVEIATIGTVQNSGTSTVRPTATTTYRLTARNRNGSVTADTTVTVNAVTPPDPAGPVTIAACSASPGTSAKPGDPIRISYTTTNAASVAFAPAVAGSGLNGPVTVNPTASSTYTITATGADSKTATCTLQ